MSVGVPMESRAAAPPKLNAAEMAAKGKLAQELAPRYRTELLKAPE